MTEPMTYPTQAEIAETMLDIYASARYVNEATGEVTDGFGDPVEA